MQKNNLVSLQTKLAFLPLSIWDTARLDFVIPGEPNALARHRIRILPGSKRRRAIPVMYDPPENKRAKSEVGWIAHTAMIELFGAGYDPRLGQIAIRCMFGCTKPQNPTHDYPSKKDTDNYMKLILDALNGIAYKDDVQVIALQAQKRYVDFPGVRVQVYWGEGAQRGNDTTAKLFI